jgi:hypothetical protein
MKIDTDSVNNPASYLERQQKRIDNITRIVAALLSGSRYRGLSDQEIVDKAVDIYYAIADHQLPTV